MGADGAHNPFLSQPERRFYANAGRTPIVFVVVDHPEKSMAGVY
jgi:hypothetical protein